MHDREKVIKALEDFNKSRICLPHLIPWDEIADTLVLLKEQGAKTGHWIESKCHDKCFWVCSECNFPSEAIAAPKLYKYCPNCGIKMDEQAVKRE